MFSYKVKIKTPNGDKLWRGDLPFLPRVGDTVKFNHDYRVAKVQYHLLRMGGNKVPVNILVEREEEKHKPVSEKSKGCWLCSDYDNINQVVCYLSNNATGGATDIPLRHCPICGRQLEEDEDDS